MTATPHPLDHLVLPVTDIATGRERLGRLGFTVAADGRHPFGTENCCIFLADKTYLEPLGIADAGEYRAAIQQGNMFIARDDVFRFRRGDDGFSAVVFGTDDAERDQAAYVNARKSGGDMLEFSRPIKMPDGSQSTGAFRLAFATDLRAPDFFFFACQRINAFPSDRKALETHANDVTGLRQVVLAAEDPIAFGEFAALAASATHVETDTFGVEIALPNVSLSILSPKGLEAHFGMELFSADRGLRGAAIVFAVGNLAVTAAHLAANGVTYTHRNNRILVSPAPGQGALFAFEEI